MSTDKEYMDPHLSSGISDGCDSAFPYDPVFLGLTDPKVTEWYF